MKLFNLQRRAEHAAETGAECCYHCGKAKHRSESVFCPDCFPEPGSLPAMIHERPHPEPKRRAADLFALLLRPIRHANNLRLKLLACQDDKRDLEQANLALRRKCADLKAQRDSALELLAESTEKLSFAIEQIEQVAKWDNSDPANSGQKVHDAPKSILYGVLNELRQSTGAQSSN